MQRSAPLFLIILGFVLTLLSCNQNIKEGDDLLTTLMEADKAKFAHILKNKDSLEIQIIYTQINRDENNVPHFQSFYFNVDSARYFYPASTVELL